MPLNWNSSTFNIVHSGSLTRSLGKLLFIENINCTSNAVYFTVNSLSHQDPWIPYCATGAANEVWEVTYDIHKGGAKNHLE